MTDDDVQFTEGDDWEEIDPQEVEAVTAALDKLIAEAKSDNIKAELQAAIDKISEFVEWEGEDDQAEAA